MDERIRALLDSTAAKAAATYYVVAAIGLFRILGRLSSPNPKLQSVALRDLTDGASSSLVGAGGAESPSRPLQQQSSSSSQQAPMKRKLVRGSGSDDLFKACNDQGGRASDPIDPKTHTHNHNSPSCGAIPLCWSTIPS